MKKNEIIRCLKANRNISAYEITIVDKDSRELFYVLDHLEINRAVKTRTIGINVYVSDKKTTGSSQVRVTAADDEKSLKTKLSRAVKQAKAARNPYFPLCDKTENISDLKKEKKDLNLIASKVAEAVMAADTYEEGWINSTEIFVSNITEEFINSNGIDHKADYFRIQIECIPTWSDGKEEFELYKFYESDKADYKQITKEIDEILKSAKDRSIAKTIRQVRLPKDLPVLVKTEMLETIMGNFADDLSYRNAYMKQAHYQKGDLLSDNPFDLTMKGNISGCAGSRKFDSHGVSLRSRNLIRKGKVNGNYGDLQFGYYQKEKDISGSLPVCEIKAEGVDYTKEKHLIIDAFSAPQLESDSGYWGGEVRLARYFDGKRYIPLTGFSISGMIYDDIKKVQFSREQTCANNYKGPEYLIFKGIKIS